MATGAFTYNSLRTKKERIKTQQNCKSFKLNKSNAVSIGTTAVKPCLNFYMPSGLSLIRKVLEMYSRHLFSNGGFLHLYYV